MKNRPIRKGSRGPRPGEGGRPTYDFWTDPDRFAVVFADVLQAACGVEGRQAYEVAAAAFRDHVGDAKSARRVKVHFDGERPDGALSYSLDVIGATKRNAADALRKKARSWSEDQQRWRANCAALLHMALFPASDLAFQIASADLKAHGWTDGIAQLTETFLAQVITNAK